ncbi:GNAT family N-acetyltransferase [Nocardia altamirensis]|uniref:GNAT family N-acetyltransferase n=1 Tax=Nocardia altamirensis TaxID=472158 RepID=UPI0008400E12|nr:N-acetyltransferase [Nocardia altamirensis]
MTIRTGTRQDVESVAALHTESWRTAYAGIMPDDYLNGSLFEERYELWQSRLAADAPEGQLFTADEAGEMLGFVYLVPRSDDRVLVDNLHVRPHLKRSGIGSRLLHHALRWSAHEHPGSSVYLEVLQANTSAIAFYERHGARRTAERVAHFEQGFDLPELEYTWTPAAIALLP